MILGFDAGGSSLKSVMIEDGTHRELEAVPLPVGDTLDFVLEQVTARAAAHRPRAVGLGLAGLVHVETGLFVWGPHLEGESIKVRAELESRLDIPVAVDNDANLAALAEHRLGSGRGTSPMVLVALGTGIGCGIVIDGNLFRGRQFAGEAGHMMVAEDGAPCACGSRGCWETTVSGSTLDALARDRWGATAGGADLVTAAETGDPQAVTALEGVGRWLGRGLVNLTLMIDPEMFVIGGAAASGRLVTSAREELARRLPGAGYRQTPTVVLSRYGRLSGAIGAALAGGDMT